MDKVIAEKLVDVLISMDRPLNEAAVLIENIEEPGEKKVFRKAIAEIVGRSYSDLMAPIFKQYPDLDRDTYYAIKKDGDN